MEQYPTNLFAAVANNIVKRFKGLPADGVIMKEAKSALDVRLERFEKVAAEVGEPAPPAAANATEQAQAMKDFLAKYQFSPQQFVSDPVAGKFVGDRASLAKKNVKQLYANQSQMIGGMTPQMAQERQKTLGALDHQATQATVRRSLLSTMGAEQKDPAQFGQMVDLSNRSQAAFGHNHTTEIATPLAGVAGAAGGALFGKTPARRALGALGGGGMGALFGHVFGRKVEEDQTGYSHNDVLHPYEAGYRLDRRIHADRVK